jgi:hypothetical protein
MHTIVVRPERRDPSNPPRQFRFEARLDDRLLCVSHQPFVDAARVLIADGYDPNATLAMRHAGSETIALTARLGRAARFAVEEGDRAPGFVRFKPRRQNPAEGSGYSHFVPGVATSTTPGSQEASP